MTYNELKSEENKYVMNTYGRFPIALDHGEGATLWDVEGKKYIDLASGIGVNCLGYANPAIIDAIDKQAHKLMHVSNLFTTEPMVQVAKKLVEKTHLAARYSLPTRALRQTRVPSSWLVSIRSTSTARAASRC